MRKTLLVLSLAFPLLAVTYPSPPPPDHYVLDQAEVLTDEEETRINDLCREVERLTTAEMAVLTIPTTGARI